MEPSIPKLSVDASIKTKAEQAISRPLPPRCSHYTKFLLFLALFFLCTPSLAVMISKTGLYLALLIGGAASTPAPITFEDRVNVIARQYNNGSEPINANQNISTRECIDLAVR